MPSLYYTLIGAASDSSQHVSCIGSCVLPIGSDVTATLSSYPRHVPLVDDALSVTEVLWQKPYLLHPMECRPCRLLLRHNSQDDVAVALGFHFVVLARGGLEAHQ
jgi:hypothetical protein